MAIDEFEAATEVSRDEMRGEKELASHWKDIVKGLSERFFKALDLVPPDRLIEVFPANGR